MSGSNPHSPAPRPTSRGLLVGAFTFGALVLLTPAVALVFREPLHRGGVVGLLTLYGLAAVLLVLSLGCLVLFLRGYAQATVPPDHDFSRSRPTGEEQELMRAFDFDAEDLRANRAGGLSARQRANLRAGRTAMVVMGATMLGVTYLSITAVPALMEFNQPGTAQGASGDSGMWIALAMVTALVGGSFAYAYRKVRHQFRQRFSFAEGAAREEEESSRSVKGARIGDVIVPIHRRRQAQAIRMGQWYRVCFIPGPIAIVLSIDPRTPPQDRASF